MAVAVKKEKKGPEGDSHLLKRTPREKAMMAVGIIVALGLLAFALRPAPDPLPAGLRSSWYPAASETDYYEPFIDEFNSSQKGCTWLSVTPSIAYQQKLVVLLGARMHGYILPG